MNDLPVIGLSTGRMFLEGSNLTGMERVIVNGDYIGAVKKADGLSVPVPPVCSPDEIRQYVKLCDGIIITGGLDAAPILYGEMPHPGCGIFDLDMDRTHIELIREAIRQGKPLLGICRGMQLINVALGGTLYQDIPSQCPGCGGHSYTYIRGDAVHSVTLDEGSPLHRIYGRTVLDVNSIHHQSVKECGKGVEICARSADGIAEGLCVPGQKILAAYNGIPKCFSQNQTNRSASLPTSSGSAGHKSFTYTGGIHKWITAKLLKHRLLDILPLF